MNMSIAGVTPGPQRDQAVGEGGVRGRLAQGVHPLLEHPQRGRLTAARLAPGEVGQRPLPLCVIQLTVDQGRQALAQVAHAGPPVAVEVVAAAGTRVAWRGRRCSSATRSCARPRWMRLRTVPSFTPRVLATSS